MSECSCGKAAARDCENDMCGDCCPGCPRHPSEEECNVCSMLMHECECTECSIYHCSNKVPYDCEYYCDRCGPMCQECFGDEYISWDGGRYCESCGHGMHNGGIDNRGPSENW